MNHITVNKEEYLELVSGANKLMKIVEELKEDISRKDIEINSLQFLKTKSEVDVSETLQRIKKFINDK